MFCQIRALAPLVVASLTAALAVPARGEVLDEITVTAQKREESIQDVGIAISAFTGAQLKALGIEKSIDVAAFVPGVSTSGALAGQNTQFTIRGVTQNDFNDIVESPNAVYLDEGYIAVAQGQTFALFDIDRVEILKGPQGTLFGRNATGGLVQYISRKPSKEKLEAFADVSYGSYDAKANANTIRFEGAVGGPISSMLGARIAGLYVQDDAYLKNLYRSDTANYFGAGTFAGNNSFAANSPGSGAGADLGGGETKAVRGTLEFDPLDILRLTLSGNYAKTTMPTGPYLSKPTIAIYNGGPPDPLVQGSTGELVNVLNMPGDETKRSICGNGSDCGSDQDNNGFPDNLDGVPGADLGRINNQFQLTAGGDFFGYKNPSGTKDFVFSGDFAFKDQGHTETKGMGLRVERDLNDRLLLTSITDYKNFDKLLFIDVDSAPVNQSANFAGVDAQTWTQELRLNRALTTTAGSVACIICTLTTDQQMA